MRMVLAMWLSTAHRWIRKCSGAGCIVEAGDRLQEELERIAEISPHPLVDLGLALGETQIRRMTRSHAFASRSSLEEKLPKSNIAKLRNGVRVCGPFLFGALLAALVVAAPVAKAQEETAKDLIVALERRSDAVETIGNLERLASRILYVQSVALLSHYGGWPGEGDAGWHGENAIFSGEIPKFFYDVENIQSRFTPEIITLRRNGNRPGVFTEEELAQFSRLIDELENLIEGSQGFYELLKDRRVEDANEFFREDVRLHYSNITSGSYTLQSGVSRDIDRIIRLSRSVE